MSSEISSPVLGSSGTGTSTTTTNTSNSFSAVVSQWKQFNIEQRKRDLGDSVGQIGESKEDCLKSRKVLAKQTQEFKKLADDEKTKQFNALLKLYQDEVDKLTKRSKFSETCFLGLFKDLSDVSDPVPALNAAIEEASKPDHSGRLELENKKLMNELAEFKKEFQEIQNQEVTIRRLEDRIKELESRGEASANERANVREMEIRGEMKERVEVLTSERDELARHMQALQEEIAKLSKINYEAQSQLMEMRTKSENDAYSKQSEIDLLTNELDRVSGKLNTLETENTGMREESSKEKNHLGKYVKRISDLELELLSRENDISRYVDLNGDLKSMLKKEEERAEELKVALKKEEDRVREFERYIKENPSPVEYENMKKELQALQSVVGSEEISNTNQDTKLLKDKNRQLESESTRLRLQISEQETELSSKTSQLSDLEATIEKQNQLILNLERDLNSLDSGNAQQQGNSQQNSNSNNNLEDTNEDLLNIIGDKSSLSTSLGVKSNADPDAGKTLEIVIGQRDRFKLKIDQLESDKTQSSKQIEQLRVEISSLKNDNIKLFEKIKFLQSYKNNGGTGTSSGSFSSLKRNSSVYDVERGGNTGTEEKYGKLYEESINPFLSFNKKEKYRRYKEMNTAERVILNGSRFFLSNKYSRLFLFIYSILLHLLVFVTLYKLAVTTTEQHQYDFDPNNPNNHQTPPLPTEEVAGTGLNSLLA